MGSNGSSKSSSSSHHIANASLIPTSFSMNFRQHNGNAIIQTKPKSSTSKHQQQPPPRPFGGLMNATQRSKSNNDLYYELERTNSAQDLLELINDCAPPVGDMSKYKLLLSECEKFTPTKSKNRNKKPNPQAKPTVLVKQQHYQQQQQIKPTMSTVHGTRPTITNSNNCSSFSYSSSSPRSDSVSMTSGDSLEMISAKTNSINTNNQVIESEDSLSTRDEEEQSRLKHNHRRSLSLPSYAAVAEALALIQQQQQQQNMANAVRSDERDEALLRRMPDFHSINHTESHVEYKNEFKHLQ